MTRAESQAQTRQELLDAAEPLFLEKGYHATSIAAIAEAAGRTVGAVYSNFEGKEELCLEVLKSRYLNELARFMNKVVQSDGSVEGRLAAMTSWISELTDETRFVILTAEYLTSTFSDEGQTAANRELLDRIRDSVGVIIEDALPDKVSVSNPLVQEGVDSTLATALGLGVSRAAGLIDGEQLAAMMAGTLRMWLDRIEQASRITLT
ncbi:TetR/AcrR family transcriptional regulator [Mycobacteroides abscessus]|uniref:TetR/AcrR family transcriptional regulator n=1 Tax=Mycobacteroides abscessus TaxID=36809 RepID=UPI000379925C|nr:TetR/AcrR family transcriptional regulator [Mycobacteroides abscessus]AWG50551.1 TetR/AcrR family transcriptional regulator [Mycobacteroides abscessus]MBN7365005.1 TetR/AcrR family transcriptional regulator [Mycobacteroides abscessus subsp. abscessus]MBN7489623.1 TetR/AcrR family transcriptional regulator [Mycobacteroides abscessus subsp. abscessus]MBN7495427.1 TetR/AcrR family transcriptional regulator [Mycobacteroides abscessus subsp. abscessus]MBN7550358.1 TetR/AcrR family transcriptiona